MQKSFSELTPDNYAALGYDAPPVPEPVACEHCQKPLRVLGMAMPFGDTKRIVRWLHVACECPGAVSARDAEQTAAEQHEEAERRRARMERLLRDSHIKPRFIQRTFETFKETAENTRALEVCQRYATNFEVASDGGRGLYLVGGIGLGKTHLAIATALRLIDAGRSVLFTTMIDLLGELKATFGQRDVNEYTVMRAYRRPEVLVLDDLGKELPSEWALSVLFSIVNDRYEEMKPLLVTTQYEDDELARRLCSQGGDMKTATAIIDRLHEMCFPVRVTGEKSWRSG